MRHAKDDSGHQGIHVKRLLQAAILFSIGLPLFAQRIPSNGVEIQRAAMKKLAFLTGQWSGPATIMRGPGKSLHLTQSENVQYKLDGLVILIQGKSAGADGKAQFEALATISYDESSHTYRLRAYNGGNYVNTELTVVEDGFSWGYSAGPVHIVNTMHLTAKGEWQETSEASYGSNPPHPSVSMLLSRQS